MISKSKSSKNDKRKNILVEWDDLIGIAEENIERNQLKLTQLQALVRYFQASKDRGEPCPISNWVQ